MTIMDAIAMGHCLHPTRTLLICLIIGELKIILNILKYFKSLVFVVLSLMDALDYGFARDTHQLILSSLAQQLETNGMWKEAAQVQMMNANQV